MSFEIKTHRNLLVQILKDIFTDASINSVLGFKGGTAVYLFYDPGRFSVDIDLDLLDFTYKDIVYEKTLSIIEKYGEIKDSVQKEHTLLFEISYEERMQNIKVEINLRDYGSIYELKNYLGIAMKVMVQEDIFAHKLTAMLDRNRKTNRDIYDIWFFLKNNWQINKLIIEKRTGKPLASYLKNCIKYLEQLSSRNILSGMGDLLNEEKTKWVKTNLLIDTIFLLKLLLKDYS